MRPLPKRKRFKKRKKWIKIPAETKKRKSFTKKLYKIMGIKYNRFNKGGKPYE